MSFMVVNLPEIFPSNISEFHQKHKNFILRSGIKSRIMSNPFVRQTSAPPRPLKILLAGITVLTFAGALWPSLSPLLGLSKEGIRHFFLWQWLSYSFFEPSAHGINGSLLIQLGFSLYLLWVFGASLIERLGLPRFFCLLSGSAFFGGLGAWTLLETLQMPTLFIGPAAALYGCLFAWTLLNAQAKLLLFAVLPLNASIALYFLIAITFLIDLSQSNWPALGAFFASLVYAYFFSLLCCKVHSPFRFLFPFEKLLFKIVGSFAKWPRKTPKIYRSSKIYDIRSGKPILDDEQFLDAMLTRISLYGENALSPEEKSRMNDISRGRKRK